MATLKVANIHFDAAGTTVIRANGANTLTFNTAGSEDARIDAAGNVLINRTNSTVGNNIKLDVNGGINSSAILINGSSVIDTLNGANAITNAAFTQANTARTHANSAFDQANTARSHANSAFEKANSTTYTSNVVISVADNTNAALRITQTGTGVAIRVEDEANPDATPFIVDATGNVLISRTNSTVGSGVKLDVAGAINASSILVNGTELTSGGNYVLQVYTNTSPSGVTWTKPAGLKAIKVTVVGGGAGTANASAPGGAGTQIRGGAGGGGTSVEYIPAPSIPGPVTVTVGAGGTVPAPTNAGGTSSFGAFLSATGGSAGSSAASPATSTDAVNGGAGGTGTGGSYNVSGGNGGGTAKFQDVSPTAPSVAIVGGGGSSTLGFGGSPGAGPNGTVTPADGGKNYGGGASGAFGLGGGGGTAIGANGAQGIVIVEEFY